nr:DUF1793 domain-containing protein [Hymenobacter nivis]
MWDNILDLKISSPEVTRQEVAFCLMHQQKYGLPLDSRRTYTKSDWTLWTAMLADNPADFAALIAPIWQFANDTPPACPSPTGTKPPMPSSRASRPAP